MKRIDIHPRLRDFAAVFTGSGKQAYLVGGAVRDLFLGEKARDWDLATDAKPEEVIAMFRNRKPRCRVIPTGIKHGTVTVFFKGEEIEVTTFRTESDYRDGRHPEKVEFVPGIEEDLSRRDFTMNAIALKLPEGEIVDPFGGKGDIRARLIRCVGNPAERFGEDGLRPLRAIRFASQLGFSIDEASLAAIPGALATCSAVAMERIRDELDKTVMHGGKPSVSFLLMEKTGLLELILPELAGCRGIEQKGYHRFDVLDHSLLALDYAAANGFPRRVRLAALFHDLGKPLTRNMGEDGVWTFYRHEEESARLTEKILTRLRYPNMIIEETARLVAEHMFHYDDTWTDAAVRRFIVRAGETYLEDLFRLRMADSFGMTGIAAPATALSPLLSRVDAVLAAGRAFSLKDLAINGKDLMEAGIPAGKYMGIILNELLETVLDDPECNVRETLLDIALKINRRYEPPRPEAPP
ncbi:MAG: HD domain-containing protein [Treponema sp.]|jgi:putative nucleotidyltransferase with HDIG domain|nr:HD domain-containing protein [Treponema sp.]